MEGKFSEICEFTEWSQFKDPLHYQCLTGSVVTPWSLTQKVEGSNNLFYKKKTVAEFSKFSENI